MGRGVDHTRHIGIEDMALVHTLLVIGVLAIFLPWMSYLLQGLCCVSFTFVFLVVTVWIGRVVIIIVHLNLLGIIIIINISHT